MQRSETARLSALQLRGIEEPEHRMSEHGVLTLDDREGHGSGLDALVHPGAGLA